VHVVVHGSVARACGVSNARARGQYRPHGGGGADTAWRVRGTRWRVVGGGNFRGNLRGLRQPPSQKDPADGTIWESQMEEKVSQEK
jgi:hypothetical protein